MKKNEMVSVITVCYNAQKTIRKTLESVLAQSFRPLQYILVDGKSTDCTLAIINEYQEQFKRNHIEMIIVSEKDTGIYNAMNKGVHYATGEWILYMNADDYFYGKDALLSIAKYINDSKIDIIYGDEYIYDHNGDGFINKRGQDISAINRTLPFCHQSSLVRKKWLFIHPFEEKYKIVSDYEFFLFCFKNNAVFKYCDTVIAAYFKEGTSRKMFKTAIDESFEVKGKYGIINSKRIDLILKKELRKIYTALQVRHEK